MMKVYGAPLSGSTARVLVTLYEKGVEKFEFVRVDMEHGAHKSPEFVAMQPFGQVPVLCDGTLTLFESRAIARFIAHKYEGEGASLFGSSARDAAIVEQWLEVESQSFNPPASCIARELTAPLYTGRPTDEVVVKENVEKLGGVLDIYEEHLANNKYLAGDFFSLADLSHLSTLNHPFLSRIRGEVLEGRPRVKAWMDLISARPAWQTVSAMMHQNFAVS